MHCLGHCERRHGRGLVAPGLEERRYRDNFDPLVEFGENIRFCTEQRHPALIYQRICNRSCALGMTPPLVMDEIADGAFLVHAGIPSGWRMRS